tara:strand:- start:1355 stop:1519 length:165 start_codon:yes stop_codon:yes gene_type:complete
MAEDYYKKIDKMKRGLYANMNAKKKAGTSNPKSKSTVDEKTYQQMSKKEGSFKE